MESATNIKPVELRADKIAFWTILLVIFLTPLFFIPSAFVPFQFAKVLLLYVGVAVAFCACIIARLKDGVLRIPWSYLILSLFLIPVVCGLSALFSPVRSVSFIGQGFEVGTLTFMAAVTLFSLFVAYFFTTKSRIAYSYFAFLLPVPLVMLFQIIRLFAGQNVLSFGVFITQTASMIGGWNDLGIYFGAVALFAFMALELLKFDRWINISFSVILAISLFILSVVNFTAIWYILAVLALIFFVYNFSFNASRAHRESEASGQPMHNRSMPMTSLIVIIVSVIFILLHGTLYQTLPFLNNLSISNVEVRPSWIGTFDVVRHTLASHPIFGVGPNRFTSAWLNAKPDGVNSTIFWSTDFNYGVGLLPSFIATTGILGALSWLIFFVLFLTAGFKALFIKSEDPFTRYATVSSFILALYLWILAIIYVPSAALLILTFFFTGIFIATLSHLNLTKTYSLNFVRDPRLSFASVLIFIALLLGMLGVGYALTKKFVADVYFNKALVDANTNNNVDGAESNLIKSVQLSQDSQFYRTLSDLYLVKINLLLSNNTLSQDALQNQFRVLLGNAQAASQAAVNLDKTDYQNWVSLGKVYESVVPFNVTGAYDSAFAAYSQAKTLNPQNPAIPLILARLDIANHDVVKAKQNVNEALALKDNYTDALFFLSQIQANEGDLANAIKSVQAAAYLNPNDAGIYFELGLLRYNNKDYAGAASALEQAIALTPNYANAKYFLGISYYQLKRNDDAIKQFQDLKASNPDSKEVSLILSNLQAGRDPFAGAQPPLDNKPEKRANPPLKEPTTSTAPSTAGI